MEAIGRKESRAWLGSTRRSFQTGTSPYQRKVDGWRKGSELWAACADGRAGLVWIAAPKMGALRKGVEGLGSSGRVREVARWGGWNRRRGLSSGGASLHRLIDCWREGSELWAACADGRAGLVWIAAPKMGALRKGVEGLESRVMVRGWEGNRMERVVGLVRGHAAGLSRRAPVLTNARMMAGAGVGL